MSKSLNQERTHTDGYSHREPDYIKIYIGTQLCLNNLDPRLAPIIIAFSPFMTYANNKQYTHMICMNSTVFESVASCLNISTGRAKQHVKKLVDAGIFIPIYKRVEKNGVITYKKRRAQYFVNPWVVAKGSWRNIKKLQQSIDYVTGSSSYCIENESEERKIQCNLPANCKITRVNTVKE